MQDPTEKHVSDVGILVYIYIYIYIIIVDSTSKSMNARVV